MSVSNRVDRLCFAPPLLSYPRPDRLERSDSLFTVSGPAPCSGAERRNKELDEVSTAILGGAAAENAANHVQNLGIHAQILSGAFAGCEALRTEQPANVPDACDSQRCRGSEATSTTPC